MPQHRIQAPNASEQQPVTQIWSTCLCNGVLFMLAFLKIEGLWITFWPTHPHQQTLSKSVNKRAVWHMWWPMTHNLIFVTSVTYATSVTPINVTHCDTMWHYDTKIRKMPKYANEEIKYLQHILTLCDTLTPLWHRKALNSMYCLMTAEGTVKGHLLV
jgi:hypothetical protein